MPPEKTWIHRVSLILDAIGRTEKTAFSRLDIEDLFEISRRRAHTLIHQIGGATQGPRGSLSLPRPALVQYLQQLQRSPEYEWTLNRKKRITLQLREAAIEVKQRRIEIPVNPRVYLTKFANLSGVLLSQGRLEISFSDAQDLLQKLAAFSQAISNEYSDFLKRANGA